MNKNLAIGLTLSVVGFALPCSPLPMFLVGLALCMVGGFYLGAAFTDRFKEKE